MNVRMSGERLSDMTSPAKGTITENQFQTAERLVSLPMIAVTNSKLAVFEYNRDANSANNCCERTAIVIIGRNCL